MGIKVLKAEEADIPRCFAIASDAFARNEPYFDVAYPEHWTAAGRVAGGQHMIDATHDEPFTTIIKAVDESTGEIVGMAKWNVWVNTMPDLSVLGEKNYWPTQDDRELFESMFATFIVPRNDALKNSKGHLVGLDCLTIDPAHQRRGIGGALVKWGTDIADQMGVETVVESSIYGKGLYQKNGFVFLKDVELEVPEKWKATHKHLEGGRFAWLVRPKKNAS